VTARSGASADRIACRAPREGHPPAAERMPAPGPAQALQAAPRGGRCCLGSRTPGHSAAGTAAATCAPPTGGPRASVPGPEVIRGTTARPRQARLGAMAGLAGTAGLAPRAGSRPDTTARHQELYTSRLGVCSAPVPDATEPFPAAGSRVAGLAAGAVG